MTDQGDCAAHRRDGDDVIKVLDGQHPAGARFVAAAQHVGVTGMNAYLSTLRAAGVALPPGLSVESARPLAVRHRWVTGPVLLDHASVDPSRFVDAVIEIARWARTLDATDARVDTNLANFCLADNRVVLVDVLPPLILSVRPEPSNLFEVLFGALCFDTTVILDALRLRRTCTTALQCQCGSGQTQGSCTPSATTPGVDDESRRVEHVLSSRYYATRSRDERGRARALS